MSKKEIAGQIDIFAGPEAVKAPEPKHMLLGQLKVKRKVEWEVACGADLDDPEDWTGWASAVTCGACIRELAARSERYADYYAAVV